MKRDLVEALLVAAVVLCFIGQVAATVWMFSKNLPL